MLHPQQNSLFIQRFPAIIANIRIFLYPFDMNKINSICVFSGSTLPENKRIIEGTIALGKKLADEGITLVYGGGNRGLMGIIASTVKENGGRVIGVLPSFFDTPTVRTKDNESELIITEGMHERKKTMYEKADAFIALPGGIGTFEELFEAYTWRQIGLHKKPVMLFNLEGFFDTLLKFLDETVKEGFLMEEVKESLLVANNADTALSLLRKEQQVLPSKIEDYEKN